jgi:hypothetical protein
VGISSSAVAPHAGQVMTERNVTSMAIPMMPNDRVERPATMTVPRPDATPYASRSASNALLDVMCIGVAFTTVSISDAFAFE